MYGCEAACLMQTLREATSGRRPSQSLRAYHRVVYSQQAVVNNDSQELGPVGGCDGAQVEDRMVSEVEATIAASNPANLPPITPA